MSRKFFVGGNWKLNGSVAVVAELVNGINRGLPAVSTIDVLVAPPALYLQSVKATASPSLKIAAQNCWKDKKGAFTGENSPEQLVDSGIHWVILGHSERRSIFGESNEVVGEKTKTAIASGLFVIFCVGEVLEERKSGKTQQVVYSQLKPLQALKPQDWQHIVIAYEPVWAIGTGVVATPEQAQETQLAIRKWLADNISQEVAAKTRIIYGGSVNAKNSADLVNQPDIDGFLVGGASLKAEEFLQICASGKSKAKL